MMPDLKEARAQALVLRRMIQKGQNQLAAEVVESDLLTPLLQLLDFCEAEMVQRWLTLAEAIERSGRSRNYFEKGLASLGGKPRLEHWEATGSAERTAEGLWLIHPSVVPERADADRVPEPASNSAVLTVDEAQAIADELMS